MALEAVLVLVFLLSPGVVADAAYRFLAWRPDPSDQSLLVRATVISAVSMFALVAMASIFPSRIQTPPYIDPSWWRSPESTVPWTRVIGGWALHTAVAVAGMGLVWAIVRARRTARVARALLKRSLWSSAWDEFAAENVGRWVVARTKSGEEFYGFLGTASGDRKKDVVLYRPAPYNQKTGVYEITGNKAIFIPEDQVERILVPLIDKELEEARPTFGLYEMKTGERTHEQESDGHERAGDRDEASPGEV